jgi:hypothetical protein
MFAIISYIIMDVNEQSRIGAQVGSNERYTDLVLQCVPLQTKEFVISV